MCAGVVLTGVMAGVRCDHDGLGRDVAADHGGPPRAGLFGYLIRRDQNKTKIRIEVARQEAARDLIDHLPSGAVYREATANGWREVWMPDAPRPSLFVVLTDNRHLAPDPSDAVETPGSPGQVGAPPPSRALGDGAGNGNGDDPEGGPPTVEAR
jgi:hypothetical protein